MEVLEVSPRTPDEKETGSRSSVSQSKSKESNFFSVINLAGPHEINDFSVIASPETSEAQFRSSVLLNETLRADPKEVQVLYSRVERPIFVQNSESIPEIGDNSKIARFQTSGRPPLTKIDEYRLFMEASISLKTFLLELIHKFKTNITILERTTSILRDPGFGGINILRCWIWIFEEALILTKPIANDKLAWKNEVAKLMKDIVTAYQNIWEVTERLEISYGKLKKDFAKLSKNSTHKFHKNINGAQEVWNKMEKTTLKKDLEVVHVDWITPTELKSDKKILKVRWGLDGITLKFDGGSQWLKFISIKEFKDKQTLVSIFKEGLKDPWNRVNRTLLETEKFMISQKHTSVTILLKKLLRILDSETKYVFVPKEEVMMLNSILTNLSVFEAVQPLLDNLKKRMNKNLELVLELSNRQSGIVLGKGKRVPLGRWSELLLELQVDSSVEMIFNRNSNKTSNDDGINQMEIEVRQESVEIICPPYNGFHDLSTPNPEEEELGREETGTDVIQANPTLESVFDTCYIFIDIRPEYETAMASILRNLKFEESHLELCTDRVKKFYEAVNKMEEIITECNDRLIKAREYILSSDSDPRIGMPTSTWITIICRLLSIWDCRDLSAPLIKRFHTSIEDFLTKSENLEASMSKLMYFMTKQNRYMKRLDECLMGISGYNVAKQIKFKQETIYKDPSEAFNEAKSNHYDEQVNLNFIDLNMEVRISPNSGTEFGTALSFKDSPDQLKVEMICNPFHHVMRTMDKAILNIAWTTNTLVSHLKINSVQDILIPKSNVFLPHYQKLETTIIACIVERLKSKKSELIESLRRLDDTVGNLSEMIHLVLVQIAKRKLISAKVNPIEMEDNEIFQKVIEQMPNSIQILDIVARGEYRRLVEHGITDLKLVSALENSSKESVEIQKIQTAVKPKMPLYAKLTPTLLQSECLRGAYMETLVFWLKRFDKQMSENLTNSLSALINPKVSQTFMDGSRISGFINLDKAFGFVDGLTFLLRESIETLKNHDQSSSAKDKAITKIKSNLILFAAIIHKFEDRTRRIGPILKKLTYSVFACKGKIPRDMSFLDDKLEELSKTPDLFKVQLKIWKGSNNDDPVVTDQFTPEMELKWESSNKYKILTRSSTKPIPWIEFSEMNYESQTNAIIAISDSSSNAFNQACNYLIKAEREITIGKIHFKHVWNKLRDDEKASVIPPSSVYVILKHFEYSISSSTMIYEAINNIIANTKAALAIGMQHLQILSSKEKEALKRTRKYPESMIIKVIIQAPNDIDQWLKIDSLKGEMAQGDHEIPIIEIKAAVEMKSISSSVNVTYIEEETSQDSLSQNLSFTKISRVLLPKKSTSKDDLFTVLKKTENIITSILRETCAILRSPDTSLLETARVDHFSGILYLLLSSILELKFFREASDIQRKEIINQSKELTTRIKDLGLSSVMDDIHLNLTKIQRSADSMEKVLNKKFNQGGDASKPQLLSYIVEDLELSPEDLAEHIAVKTSSYIWNAVFSLETGIILKSHKSYESHGYMTLSLSKRISIVTSVMKYLDQILNITATNLQAVRKNLNTSNGVIKNHTKKISSLIKKEIINDSNISETLDSVRRLKSNCDASHIYLHQILAVMNEGNNIINSINSYLNLKFKLESPNLGDSNSTLRNYRQAVETKIVGYEIDFLNYQQYPITVEVPLSLSPIDINYS